MTVETVRNAEAGLESVKKTHHLARLGTGASQIGLPIWTI